MSDDSPEIIMAEFMGDIRKAVTKHFTRLYKTHDFTAAHMIIGGLEQAKQKVIRELDKMLEKALEEKYFGLEEAP